MVVNVMTRSANSFGGGNTIFMLVRRYLQRGLGSYGDAFKQLDMTACFRGGHVENRSLQRSYDYHAVFLSTLPLVKSFPKKGRIEINYETKIADASFLRQYGFLSVEVFAAALREVAAASHLMDAKLKKSDGFDLLRFHADMDRLVASAPASIESLRSLKAELERKAKERIATMDPWELLDVDWDEFHSQARRLLDQPLFWSLTDDYSPHGSDTGSDVLSDFKKWNRRNPERPAHELATSILRAWRIAPIDLLVVDEERVKELLEADEIAVSVTDDTIIAAAFAAIKFRGCCDSATKQLAAAVLERERLSSVLISRGWKNPTERIQILGVLSEALAKSPDIPSS